MLDYYNLPHQLELFLYFLKPFLASFVFHVRLYSLEQRATSLQEFAKPTQSSLCTSLSCKFQHWRNDFNVFDIHFNFILLDIQ